jgi:surface protein
VPGNVFCGDFCAVLARYFDSDISKWDVSLSITTSSMFSGAAVFDQDLSAWKTSKVTIMHHMFADASSFNHDLSTWTTSRVRDMYRCFTWRLPLTNIYPPGTCHA